MKKKKLSALLPNSTFNSTHNNKKWNQLENTLQCIPDALCSSNSISNLVPLLQMLLCNVSNKICNNCGIHEAPDSNFVVGQARALCASVIRHEHSVCLHNRNYFCLRTMFVDCLGCFRLLNAQNSEPLGHILRSLY